MKPAESLDRLRNAMAAYLARHVPVDLPRYRFDGAPIRTASELAVALGCSVIEARHRGKNLFGDEASHPVNMGVGTVLERARMLSRPKRKKRKKRRDEDR